MSEFDNLRNEAEQFATKEGEQELQNKFGIGGQQGQQDQGYGQGGQDQYGQGQPDQYGQGGQDQYGQGQQDQQDQYGGDQQSGY